MNEQVKQGIYWFSVEDYRKATGVRVWYNEYSVKRGWCCTPVIDNEPAGYTYPLSVDIWRLLRSTEHMERYSSEAEAAA